MKITQQPEPAQQDLSCAELAVRRAHGKQEGSGCCTEAEQSVPESVSGVPTDRAQQIVQQAEEYPQRAGESEREDLCAQIDTHSAEQP